MELNMTENKMQRDKSDNGKFSARMSIFAWVLCAVLGWGVALTTLNSLTSSNSSGESALTAENIATTKEAVNMENILPAAGSN